MANSERHAEMKISERRSLFLKKDELIFDFKFRKKAKALVENLLKHLEKGDGGPVRVSDIFQFFRSLFEQDMFVPKHAYPSWAVSPCLAFECPSALYPCGPPSGNGKAGAAGLIADVYKSLALDERDAIRPARSQIQTIIDGWSAKYQDIVSMIERVSYIGFIHHPENFYGMPREEQLHMEGASLEDVFNLVGSQPGYEALRYVVYHERCKHVIPPDWGAIRIATQSDCRSGKDNSYPNSSTIISSAGSLIDFKVLIPHGSVPGAFFETATIIKDGIAQHAIGTLYSGEEYAIASKISLFRMQYLT